MNEKGKAPSVEAKDIDHLGIAVGIVDEIGLVEEVDHKLGTHTQQCISSGQVLKAMILNGLGFVSAPMYLFEEFFIGKATDHLIGKPANSWLVSQARGRREQIKACLLDFHSFSLV